MSAFSTFLATAAATAQTVLTEMAGDDSGFTIAGDSHTYRGVMEEVESLLPPTGAGYEPRRMLMISATKPQFATAPSAATRPRITARGATWSLTAVKEGPHHYHLTCVPV